MLGHASIPWLAALLAVLLSTPSLDTGLAIDDLHQWAALTSAPVHANTYGMEPTPAGLFGFARGAPEDTRALVAQGVFPWWTDPELTVRFFRPLAGLTIQFDHRWLVDRPRLMHGHSLAWMFACVLSVGLVYRRWLPPATAGLAVLLFAVDDAHGLPAAWLAQRNHVMAATFGMLALLAHDTWRRRGSRLAGVLSVAAFTAALLSGEIGVTTAGLLAVYAIFLDRGTVEARAVSLLPALLVTIVWRWGVVAGGYLTRYSGTYLDPAARPLAFLGAVAERLPLLMLGQWTPVPPEIAVVAPGVTPSLMTAALVTMAALVLAFAPIVRRDRRAAACGAAMLVAVVPVCANFADTRNLLFTGIGGMGLLALYLCDLPDTLRSSGRVRRWAHACIAALLLVTHVVLAPALLWIRASLRDLPSLRLQLPADVTLTGRTVMVLNGPLAFFAAHFPLERDLAGLSVPRSTHVIGPSAAALDVTRLDAHTLRLTSPTGWYWSPLDRLMRSPDRALPPGTAVALDVASVRVDEVLPDGRPLTITCRFRVPLEDDELVWMAFVDGAYRPWSPPPPGTRVHLAAPVLR